MGLAINGMTVQAWNNVYFNNNACRKVVYNNAVIWAKALEIFSNGTSYYGKPYLQVGNGYVNTTSGYNSIYISSKSGDV